jgi:hypothetical protein
MCTSSTVSKTAEDGDANTNTGGSSKMRNNTVGRRTRATANVAGFWNRIIHRE